MNKVSIVTVTYNNCNELKRTIESVVEQIQLGADIEYIIIDGGSKDNTQEIVSLYKNYINIFVSEPDKGIYDAMNKGLKVANGCSILFLNSGDIFFKSFKLKEFQNINDLINYSYFTYTVQIDNNIAYLRPSRNKSNFDPKDFGHQGCFITKKHYSKYCYNLDYSFDADFFWMKDIWNENHHKISEEISTVFFLGGISNTFSLKNMLMYIKQPISLSRKIKWFIKYLLAILITENKLKKYLYKKYDRLNYTVNI